MPCQQRPAGHLYIVYFLLPDNAFLLAQNWGRVPALNTNPTFIDDLAAMVLEKLPSAAPRPGYMLSANEGMNLGPPSGEVLRDCGGVNSMC